MQTRVCCRWKVAFLCPIGKQLMKDPVVATDGHTYERANIEKHFSLSRRGNRHPLLWDQSPGAPFIQVFEDLGHAGTGYGFHCNVRSPMTNATLTSLDTVPNAVLRSMIQEELIDAKSSLCSMRGKGVNSSSGAMTALNTKVQATWARVSFKIVHKGWKRRLMSILRDFVDRFC